MKSVFFAVCSIVATAAVEATPVLAEPQAGSTPPANATGTPDSATAQHDADQSSDAPGTHGWCVEQLARRAGLHAGWSAYLEAKLDLTATQRPLWQKVQDAASAEAQQERQLCDATQSDDQGTVVDRIDAIRQLLSVQLAGLTEAKSALEALYSTLTPEQKEIIDHPFPGSADTVSDADGDNAADPPGRGGGHMGGGGWGGAGHPGGVRGGRYWGWGPGVVVPSPYYGYPYGYCYSYNYPGSCYPYYP